MNVQSKYLSEQPRGPLMCHLQAKILSQELSRRRHLNRIAHEGLTQYFLGLDEYHW